MVKQIDTRCDLVMFGALGDLAQRKLFPALYQLECAQLLDRETRILALARDKIDTADARKQLASRIRQHVRKHELDEEILERFLKRVDYLCFDFSDETGYPLLNEWRQQGTAS